MEPTFLNVDLVIVTRKKPKRMLAALGKDVTILVSRPVAHAHYTALEISTHRTTPQATMRAFTRVLTALSGAVRLEWDEAVKREFNFGFEVERTTREVEIELPTEVVSAVGNIKGSLGITLYNNDEIAKQAAGQVR